MKLIILALDALNHQLIEKCREEMPCLYHHLKNDAQGILKTTTPYFTGPTWTSFQTGKKISNHGVANFFKYDSNLNLKLITGEDIQEKTFYELADENNLRCFVMNLPYTDPPKIRGDLVFSWLYVYDKTDDLFWPADLIKKYPSLKQYLNRADRSRSLIRYLKTGYQVLLSQEKVVKELLSAKEHDLYFFLINAADMVQHKAFSELIAGKDNQKTRISKKILSRLDQLVGWIDKNKDEETVVLIASDHGFQTYAGKFFVNSWLKNKGYLSVSKEGKQLKEVINRRQKKKGNLDISRLVAFVKKHPLLFKLAEPFYDFFVRYCPFDLIKQQGLDFQKTKAYCRSSFEGIIFFNNLKEPEKTSLKKEILEGLNQLPGIKAYDCDQFYSGKFRSELGEIIVTSTKFEVDSTIGEKEFLSLPRDMHSLDGIFIAYGKDIKKKYTLLGANLYDVVPTLLHLLKIPLPSDMDGKALQEIFVDGSALQRREICFSQTKKIDKEKLLLDQAIKKLRFINKI